MERQKGRLTPWIRGRGYIQQHPPGFDSDSIIRLTGLFAKASSEHELRYHLELVKRRAGAINQTRETDLKISMGSVEER